VITSAFGLLPRIVASPSTIISQVRITNVNDTAFTVSWITDGDTTGYVGYGSTPSDLSQTAHDDRGASTTDDTHYVTIQSLGPATTYHFEVISGEATGDGYTVTTGSTLGVSSPDTIFGQVFKADGLTPAAGTIVYLTISDGNGSGSSGSAAPMAALVEGNGWWSANLGNVRLADLSGSFDYSASGDQLEVFAQGADDGTARQTVDTGDDTPALPMVLSGPASDATPRVFLPILLSQQNPDARSGALRPFLPAVYGLRP
jgi:hypothetical protein